MAVTVGSTEIDAGYMLMSLHGTVAEVRAELAGGAEATNYRCKNLFDDVISFSSDGVNAAALYIVQKP